MKSLKEYLQECDGGAAPAGGDSGGATPANTMGMGEPAMGQDHMEGIPVQNIRIFRRKKRKKKSQKDFEMKPE